MIPPCENKILHVQCLQLCLSVLVLELMVQFVFSQKPYPLSNLSPWTQNHLKNPIFKYKPAFSRTMDQHSWRASLDSKRSQIPFLRQSFLISSSVLRSRQFATPEQKNSAGKRMTTFFLYLGFLAMQRHREQRLQARQPPLCFCTPLLFSH